MPIGGFNQDRSPDIRCLADLERLEKKIGRLLRPHSLDAVLLSLRLIRPAPSPTARIAPLPEMIPFRLSTGVYYDMHARFHDAFDKYFGHLFEAYVGYVLRASLTEGVKLLSESDIRGKYPESSG